ncbi:MAG: hypothetical protein ACYDBY_21040, partial [Thermoanaerobaculia bacterium]
LRGAFPLLVSFPFGSRPEVRGAAFAFVLDAPVGAGAPRQRPVPLLLRSVLLLSSLEPAAGPVRRLVAPQLLAARLKRPGSTSHPAGAAHAAPASLSPSRMPG